MEEANLLDQDKQVKVKVPLHQHLRLHSLKVLTGRTISDTVAEALEVYLDEMDGVPEPSSEG